MTSVNMNWEVIPKVNVLNALNIPAAVTGAMAYHLASVKSMSSVPTAR
eukprot:CAMPEP_0198542146 /NCGR_PEP_ID=MMETSP1462-20131121/56469_1 /TAXON_ID=1333877 /ORGANISM="Brandtodinium nutriculum, Strain RCC3387" /LENGTH=47 /DNA_ID= /DNA_START= /DNA_END= /DNA_ORIENTATION=